jgi:hypothetical protein
MVVMSESINNSPNGVYIDGFAWLKYNTPPDSVILSVPEEGNLITYFSERRNVMDSQYVLRADAETRFNDIKEIYTQKFKIEALRLMEKYNIDYIVFSDKTKQEYNIKDISYINDPCFTLVYERAMKIYKINKDLCELKSE